MSLSWVDILFLATVALLVFNGLRNGAVFSLVSLLGIPVGLWVAYTYGPQFTQMLSSNGISATPIISYIVLFFGCVFAVHIVGNFIRGAVKSIPLISQGDTLLGGAIGFVEAWLLWLLLLIVLGAFLGHLQTSLVQGASVVPGVNVPTGQLQGWHDFYNQAVTNSLFAKVNGLFVKSLPSLP
ncbi:CvpA family protein [Dictyobacter halimunensis]